MFIVLYKLVQSSSHLILFPFGYMVFNLQIQVFCNSDLHIYHKLWKGKTSIMFFGFIILFTEKQSYFANCFSRPMGQIYFKPFWTVYLIWRGGGGVGTFLLKYESKHQDFCVITFQIKQHLVSLIFSWWRIKRIIILWAFLFEYINGVLCFAVQPPKQWTQ